MSELFERWKYTSEKEWLLERGKGIGGSDAASIIGCNPYMSVTELWEYKTSNSIKENQDNEHTRYGHLIEAPVRTTFQVDYEGYFKVKHTNEILISKEKPFLRASLDGEILVKKDIMFRSYFKKSHKFSEIPKKIELKKGMHGIYEGKSTAISGKLAADKWDNQIPQNYYCQILHYLNVTGYDFAILRVIMKKEDGDGVITHEIRDYAFLRENVIEDMEFLKEKEIEFWQYVQDKVYPKSNFINI